jgi:intein/homing endonuclease
MQKKELDLPIPHEFHARPYQYDFFEAMKSGKKRAVLVWHRRAGKEKTCWNYLIMKAIQQVGIYYYFFPTFSQGRKILWDGMDKTGFKFLDHIPKQLIHGSLNSAEMKLRLVNGSLIQVIGSNNIDSIVGTNPIGCIFTEYSLQDPVAWQLIRPILTENKGWAVFNFCVKEDTLVFTEKGIGQIKNIVTNSKKQFTNIDLNIFGINGYNKAISFYNGGMKKLLKITTEKGYEISCTPNHPVLSLDGWKRSDKWKVGDYIPIQRGQNCWGCDIDISKWIRPKRLEARGKKNIPISLNLNKDLSYLLGLILAEGSWNDSSITITNVDKEIIEFINSKRFKTYDKFHHTFCSKEFVSFIEWIGLKKGAKNKDFPEKIMSCSKEIVASFISGYFDGDGCATKRGLVHCDSTSETLINQMQIILLNFGIISTKSWHITPPNKKVKVSSKYFRLELSRSGSSIFFKEIGFRLKRKQERFFCSGNRFINGQSDQIPINSKWVREYSKGMNMGWLNRQKSISYMKALELLKKKSDLWLQSVIDSNYFYDKVKTIEYDQGNVYDFVIPETHSFCSNGLISHNTPRGANHAKDLYDMAITNQDWYCQKLTVDDTNVITAEDIQKERDAGMSEDYVQQEFYCSFTLGVEGSYYARYMQQARDEDRIGKVAWQRQSRVYTAWDIGYGDSCAIIFYQVIGSEIHIIDYYENNGEGLPHYAKVLFDKPYLYADHYAPHDIDSHAFSSGLSAKEVGSGLGIKFITLPTLKISIEDGIEALRGIFPRILIDEVKAKQLIKCLENYRKEFDQKHNVYKSRPLHDGFSHGADSARYMAIAVKRFVDAKDGPDDDEVERLKDKYQPVFK